MKRLMDLPKDCGIELNNSAEREGRWTPEVLTGKIAVGEKIKVIIFALGDVGGNLLIGLRLLGGHLISEIGIYDIDEKQMARYEMEVGEIFAGERIMPRVKPVGIDEIGNCDVLIFCASKGVPAIGSSGDVRMAQLDANRDIISSLGEKLDAASFKGMVFLVSDPVDPLCNELLRVSTLEPKQIRGFGLGVMYARGRYYAERDERMSSFLKEGRAYGPHGEDLVLANSIENYDDALSRELTDLAVKANMKVRELGFKPYIAPAFSSGALSIVDFLEGKWSYGSIYLGDGERGAYLGVRSRLEREEIVYEDLDLPEDLYIRILRAYENLINLVH